MARADRGSMQEAERLLARSTGGGGGLSRGLRSSTRQSAHQARVAMLGQQHSSRKAARGGFGGALAPTSIRHPVGGQRVSIPKMQTAIAGSFGDSV
jgi:hypothetical protein